MKVEEKGKEDEEDEVGQGDGRKEEEVDGIGRRKWKKR